MCSHIHKQPVSPRVVLELWSIQSGHHKIKERLTDENTSLSKTHLGRCIQQLVAHSKTSLFTPSRPFRKRRTVLENSTGEPGLTTLQTSDLQSFQLPWKEQMDLRKLGEPGEDKCLLLESIVCLTPAFSLSLPSALARAHCIISIIWAKEEH